MIKVKMDLIKMRGLVAHREGLPPQTSKGNYQRWERLLAFNYDGKLFDIVKAEKVEDVSPFLFDVNDKVREAAKIRLQEIEND